jgi:hypothetical protein
LSDADASIAERMARDADPWPAAIRLTTTGPPARTLDELLRGIGAERVDGAELTGPGNRDDT